jgi:GNAT superfamily N-acetyltransferase
MLLFDGFIGSLKPKYIIQGGLAVMPEYRGKGHARQLAETTNYRFHYGKEEGCW